jgi:hypothetical protein
MDNPWYLLSDADKYVYHYTSAAVALNFVIKNGILKFGRFKTVNDPRESIDWSFGYASLEGPVGDTGNISREVNAILKGNCNLCCFVSDDSSATTNQETRSTMPNMYERGHSRPRMWAQYAKNHSGVCLVFDRQKLHRTFKNWSAANGATIHLGE